MRAHDAITGEEYFCIKDAHTSPVNCIGIAERFFVSGGKGGKVRVWSWARELLCEFAEHRKQVTQVLPDLKTPYLFHTCALDGLVLTFDLRLEKRTVAHFVKRTGFTAMTQRRDSEDELITTSQGGYVFAWDCDVESPVMQFPDSRDALNSVALSTSGRFLAMAGDACLVKVYEMSDATGKPLKEPELIAIGDGHFGSIKSLEWSPDERQLVSVADNCSICVWNFYGLEGKFGILMCE